MELKDFITETLTQMMEGVKNAQEKAKEVGAIVNPEANDSSKHYIEVGNEHIASIQNVEFEIALTASTTEETKKGINVAFAAIELGRGKGNNEQNSAINKIKFEIPIVLPCTVQGEYFKECD